MRLAAGLLLATFLLVIVIAGSLGAVGTPTGAAMSSGGPPPGDAVADIPPHYLALYLAAGEAYGVDWSILAAIGAIESDHGRSSAPGVRSGVNFLGCCAGPMQFFVNPTFAGGGRTTWDAYGVDGDADGDRDPYDPADAIPAAGNYLAALMAEYGDRRRAIYGHNRSDAYVAEVLARAEAYRQAAARTTLAPAPSGPATGRLVEVPVEVAARRGILLDEAVAAQAIALARRFGLRISSGYRDPGTNAATSGRSRSDHLCGLAADFSGPLPAMARLELWAARPELRLGGRPGAQHRRPPQ